MTVHLGTPRSWLNETNQLDFSHPKIHFTALKLTQSLQTVRERAGAIHDFVRRLPFGAFTDFSHVRASDVLRTHHGDCHSKGVLFVALCRASGVPARLDFLRIRSRFMHGILDEGPEQMAHAVGQVLINDRWVSTDGYVVDPVMFVAARRHLAAGQRDCGWGMVRDARGHWDGESDNIHQYDPAIDVVHNYGAFDDPAEFYQLLNHDEGAPSLMTRLKYAMGAHLVNHRVSKLRDNPEPPPTVVRPVGN